MRFMNEDQLAKALTDLDRCRQPTILVVDDIADNLDLIADILEDDP